jgi:predicted MFS family arabinose efflux permease
MEIVSAVSQRRRAFVLGVLAVGYMLCSIDRQLVGVLAGPIKHDLTFSDTQLGLMAGLAFSLFYSTCALPLALLADRWKRYAVFSISLALWSLCTALCGMSHSGGQFFLARMGVGFGEAGGLAPALSLVASYYPPEKRARAIAVFNFSIPVAVGVGPVMAGSLGAMWGWRAVFFIAGLLGVALVPFVVWATRNPERFERANRSNPNIVSTDTFVAIRRLLKTSSFWFMSVGGGTCALVLNGLLFWLPSFFQRTFGLGLFERSAYFGGIMFVSGVIGIWTGGWLSDSLARSDRRLYAFIPAGSGLLSIPFYLVAFNVPWLWLAFPLLTIGLILSFIYSTPVLATMQHLVPAESRATSSAMHLIINAILGIGLGVVAVGFLSDQLAAYYGANSLKAAIIASTFVYLGSAALFLFASRTLKRDWIE